MEPANSSAKKQIWIIEQTAWKSSKGARPPMPLAGGYLKAVVLTDEELRVRYDVRTFSFAGYESIPELSAELFEQNLPDILAFSVLGWNIRTAEQLSGIYRQLKPDGWVIWGGSHVSWQGDRVLRRTAEVDVIVNGEGELTWADLLRRIATDVNRHDLENVLGISYRCVDGSIRTTENRPRIMNLDEIPSPFLTGALKLSDDSGQPLYDEALIETNRGCPYSCSFCYWGGAVGQRVRRFSTTRLAKEMEMLAKAGYVRLSLCDANFGMLPDDEQFLEICIEMKKKYGYPQYFFTSWAKNKSKTFHRILSRMISARLISTFNVALQTLTEPALELMNRKNMRINQWESLVEQLERDGLDLYAELIWGTPGDDYNSFLSSYDKLAASVPQVAVYPLLIMPNTEYAQKKKELGLVTFQNSTHDFELVLSHPTMSAATNRKMHRFLFWARIFGEQAYFRHVWKPIRELAGVTQSQFILSFDRWIDGSSYKVARQLIELRSEVQSRLETNEELLDQALRILYWEPVMDELLLQWWDETMTIEIPEKHRPFLRDVFRLDLVTRPRYRKISETDEPQPTNTVKQSNRERVRGVRFSHDVLSYLDDKHHLDSSERVPIQETVYDVIFLFLFEPEQRLFYEARNKMYFGRVRKSSPTKTKDATT
jgi:radical SAM superfamily enzyme YgiQ (UPF0313 family)